MPERDRAAVHVHALLVGAEQLASSARATDENASLISTRCDVVDRLPGLSSAIAPAFAGVAREVRELVGDVALRRRSSRAARSRACAPTPRCRRRRTRRRRSRPARCRRSSSPPGRTPAAAPRASRARCRAAGSRRPRASPTGTSSSRTGPRPAPRPRARCERSAHASCSSREMPSSRATNEFCCDHVQPVEGRDRARRGPSGRPARRRRAGSRSAPSSRTYGAFLIDSIPPVTTTSTSPARIIESAISIARIDDAHTLLIVSAGVSSGRPGADRRLPRRRLAGAALQHLAHDRVLRLARLDPDPLERGPDRDRAELGRLVARRARRRASRTASAPR